MSGAIKVFINLNVVRETLIQEGFHDPGILQTWKEGQVFSLVKPLNELLEMHVRGYEDNTLDAEVELSRKYLQHPYEVKPFYGPLIEILVKYNIPFEVLRPLPPDPSYILVPKSPIKWEPLLLIGVIGILVGLLSLAANREGKKNEC